MYIHGSVALGICEFSHINSIVGRLDHAMVHLLCGHTYIFIALPRKSSRIRTSLFPNIFRKDP